MKVICLGDSNTYGYDPRSYLGGRYGPDCRWVDILAAKTGWEIKNNGMNGCEIPWRSIDFPENTDLLMVMLGSNDLLQGNSVAKTAQRMEFFLSDLTLARDKLLLIAPPPMKRGEWVAGEGLVDASKELASHYRVLAQRLGIRFADAGKWDIDLSFDGVHFTEEGHKAFGEGLYQYLNEGEKHNA